MLDLDFLSLWLILILETVTISLSRSFIVYLQLCVRNINLLFFVKVETDLQAGADHKYQVTFFFVSED